MEPVGSSGDQVLEMCGIGGGSPLSTGRSVLSAAITAACYPQMSH